MSIRNFENDPAMLKGVVSEIGLKRSRIEIVVRPNSIFLIFFIILLFFGLFQLTMIFTGENSNNHFFGAVIIIGGALPFWIWQATRVTGSIRKNFEEYLGIHSEEV